MLENRKKALVMAILCTVASVGFVLSADAAEQNGEETMSHNLDEVIVEGESYDSKYIRTGGDVSTITSKDIEKHHYVNVTEAIKRLPGVEVQDVGYKAFEYGYSNYQSSVTINGDSRVVILVDGKRITNEANSSVAAERNKSQIFATIAPQNISRIEVIKGAAAMAYGSDATGGVINVITKKGEYASTTLDAAVGSWGAQKYAVTNSVKKDKFNWIVSYSKDKRNDMKYVDREYKKTRTYINSGYDEDNTFMKLNYDFDKNQSVEFMHTYKNTFAYYPIMAPDYSSKPALDEAINSGNFNPNNNGYDKLPQDDPAWNRYHRWWYVFNEGSFTKNRSSNYDLKYTFKDDDGIENYIRIFNDENRYYMDRNRPKFTDYTKLDYKQYSWTKDQAKGINLRWGKKINANNYLYTGVDYMNSSFSEHSYASYYPDTKIFKHGKLSSIKRDTWNAFVQDKMQFNKLTITPGLRYNYYGKSSGWSVSNKDIRTSYDTNSYSHLTMGLFANYAFTNHDNIYTSWSQVYNAPYAPDIVSAANKLEAEKGNAYTLGYSGQLKKSSFGINYTLTKMDNTFGSFSVLSEADPELFEKKVTNIASKIYSIGTNYGYKFDDNWNINLSYSHAKTTLDTKKNTSSSATQEDLRNNLHYNNKYVASISYDKNKFNTGLDAMLYTGMDTRYFSDGKFFILDLHANYKINKNITAYVLVNNITNESYETKAVAVEGIGALPMAGRNFLVGVNYTF